MENLHGFDRLSEVIEDLQMDRDRNTLVEAEVSSNVRRVFNALGWEADNHREVKPEHSVGNRKVDYALLINRTPQVFVEVKRGVEQLDKHQEQLLDYAFKEGIPLAILTNGTTWWFYLPLQPGNWESRRFAAFSLNEQEELVRVLADVLSKENVGDGSAFDNAESVKRQSRIQETMQEAWNQLIDESDELIVARIQEKVGELCKHEPDENEVKAFLKMHREDIRIHPTPAAPPRPAPLKRRKKTSTRLNVTMRDGTVIKHQKAMDTFVEVIRKIGIQRVKNLNIEVYGRDLISTSDDGAVARRKVDGYHIHSNSQTKKKSDVLKEIASHLGDPVKVGII